MNPNPTDAGEDLPDPKDLQPFVEALGGLYAAPIPVPPEVDQAVMARARLRLGGGRRALPRWVIPFAAAACLVLAIGVHRASDSRRAAGPARPSDTIVTGSQGESRPVPHPGFREWAGTSGPDANPPAESAASAGSPAATAAASTSPTASTTGATSLPAATRRLPLREDFDRNGRIDILDAFGLARRLEGAATPGPEWDLNADGVVDRRDVDLMAMAAVRIGETPR